MTITEDEKEAMVHAYTFMNESVENIAKTMQLSKSTVYGALREAGVTFGSPGRPSLLDTMSDEDLEKVVEMYNSGLRIKDVCVEFDISTNTLYQLLDKLGIPPRTQTKDALLASERRDEEAVRMYKDGWALWFIEEATSVNQMRIYKSLHRRGVQTRGQGTKGLFPMRDPQTGLAEVDDEGNYVPDLRGGGVMVKAYKDRMVHEERVPGDSDPESDSDSGNDSDSTEL